MDEAARTSRVYESNAEAFVEKYQSASIAERFWDEVDELFPGTRLLDVGCGPARDVETFADRGYDVTGFDLTLAFLREARGTVDAPFVRGDMRALPFRDAAFDGIWARASLLHVPREDVPGTLSEFHRVLDAPGALVATLKRGDESGHAEDDRYFERYQPPEIRTLLADAGFDVTVDPSGPNWLQAVGRVDD